MQLQCVFVSLLCTFTLIHWIDFWDFEERHVQTTVARLWEMRVGLSRHVAFFAAFRLSPSKFMSSPPVPHAHSRLPISATSSHSSHDSEPAQSAESTMGFVGGKNAVLHKPDTLNGSPVDQIESKVDRS